jgi:hypothetical protein
MSAGRAVPSTLAVAATGVAPSDATLTIVLKDTVPLVEVRDGYAMTTQCCKASARFTFDTEVQLRSAQRLELLPAYKRAGAFGSPQTDAILLAAERHFLHRTVVAAAQIGNCIPASAHNTTIEPRGSTPESPKAASLGAPEGWRTEGTHYSPPWAKSLLWKDQIEI